MRQSALLLLLHPRVILFPFLHLNSLMSPLLQPIILMPLFLHPGILLPLLLLIPLLQVPLLFKNSAITQWRTKRRVLQKAETPLPLRMPPSAKTLLILLPRKTTPCQRRV